MWMDVYLKFADEADFLANMPVNWQVEAAEDHATDVLGVVYRDDTGEPKPGFLVNLRLREDTPLPAELQGYAVAAPAHPARVFA